MGKVGRGSEQTTAYDYLGGGKEWGKGKSSGFTIFFLLKKLIPQLDQYTGYQGNKDLAQ